MIEQQHPLAALACGGSAEQPGGTRTEDNGVEIRHCATPQPLVLSLSKHFALRQRQALRQAQGERA
jgi:hypothetical protein